uniref:Uncharacterized protein n=1 Tax=Nelumbo nucifera TaxID=4432 RepID=A0A822Y7G2_NELNU|nr:TPA_asm: hypothetical protein HUJ06_031422 [Nelumbo nucifera]
MERERIRDNDRGEKMREKERWLIKGMQLLLEVAVAAIIEWEIQGASKEEGKKKDGEKKKEKGRERENAREKEEKIALLENSRKLPVLYIQIGVVYSGGRRARSQI